MPDMFEEGKFYHLIISFSANSQDAELVIQFNGYHISEDPMSGVGMDILFDRPSGRTPKFKILAYKTDNALYPFGGVTQFAIYQALSSFSRVPRKAVVLSVPTFWSEGSGILSRLKIVSEINKKDIPLWVPWLTKVGRDYLKTI